ncbi:MAG: TonB-dependent receptor [Methylophilus sp.]
MDKRQQIDVQHNGFKLKPISFVVCVLLTQVTWSQQVFADEVTDSNASVLPVMPPPKPAADTPLDVFDVLLGDAQAIKLPSTIEQYHIDSSIIRTAEATEPKPSSDTTPNTINTPNKSLDTKALNKKEGANLPLGNARAGQEDKNIQLDKIQVRAKRFHEIGPLPGLGLTKEQIPGNVQSITAKEIKDSHSLSLTDLLNKKLQSVNVNDYQGNPFQMDVTYRGFTAGPQIGTPQGLSVFLDGIRVNEPFGDVVNWDMIPMNAIAGVDVFPGSNPIFGLNTLGGAFTLKTKDGFTNEGVDAEVLTGSYGRKQLQVEGGWNNGDFALFGAGNFFMEDGWRDNSPSKVNQFFGKGSYRGDKFDLSLSTLWVGTDLVGNGLLPSEEYARDPSSVFTSPDTTKNKLQQFQLSGSYFVNDNFTVTGQVYRRNSKRHQVGADVMTDYDDGLLARRVPDPAEPNTCFFPSTNGRGIPDYMVVPVVNYDPSTNTLDNSQFAQDLSNGVFDINNYTSLINQPIPTEVEAGLRYTFEQNRNFRESEFYNRNPPPPPTFAGPIDPVFFNEETFHSSFSPFLSLNLGPDVQYTIEDYFFTQDTLTGVITKNHVIIISPVNDATCLGAGGFIYEITDPITGNPVHVDGVGLGQPGVVEGTPTALLTDNQIAQIVDGASVQFNWNFEQHKFMVGASIDAAEATYQNEQRLGFFDANRKAYLDAAQANPMFAGAYQPLSNNDFEGTNTTQSIYFSETWTPTQAWNFSASARYNVTKAKNKIATRYGQFSYGIGGLINDPDQYNICTDADGDGDVEANDCAGLLQNYRPLRLINVLEPAETEKFSYYSFNPSLGATWQAKENLNVFVNWAKGARTPSVIELGCAFDKTPVLTGGDPNNPANYLPKSIAENRQCTLPSTLSGDPYLEQIKATTYDVGMRGSFTGLLGIDSIEWNIGAYQTDLKDDIYFINVGNGQGFFDNVGKTRRRGLEAGLSGKMDKWGFGINYGLTDATFQDNFLMFSLDNSSAKEVDGFGPGVIEVNKGNRMPGVPLHNLNANVSYEITPKWQIGLSAVVHSESFVRGNENNKHEKGVQRQRVIGNNTILLPPTNNPGKVPGYATFNLQSSYKFNSEWAATMQVSNLFDKEYFSAGRLGRNPFSPSILGAIGPDGYNHNSGDWLSTNFIAPGAPRGIWFSLNWQFDPKK